MLIKSCIGTKKMHKFNASQLNHFRYVDDTVLTVNNIEEVNEML